MGVPKGEVLLLVLCLQLSLWLGGVAAFGGRNSWSILDFGTGKKSGGDQNLKGMSLNVYCESWRWNVEVHNIRGFDAVPDECVEIVDSYVGSSQYQADVGRAADQAGFYLTESFKFAGDGKDAWIFDVDDTLLSTAPYFRKNILRGTEFNSTSPESWMQEADAPAIEPVLNLYNDIRRRGLRIIILSARSEHLKAATVKNLMKAGYYGWTQLILRCDNDGYESVEMYKAEQRKRLIDEGYRLWGVVGDQWSSLLGHSFAWRAFKVPNPMYYVA